VRVPFVDVDDIAEVAVAALTEDGHAGRVYELTGPRELRYVPIPMDAFAAGAAPDGVPADVVSLLRYRTSPTASGRRSTASRATSRSTRAWLRRPGSGEGRERRSGDGAGHVAAAAASGGGRRHPALDLV
jgi:nucleoside-diphosphate-sugar epimerase